MGSAGCRISTINYSSIPARASASCRRSFGVTGQIGRSSNGVSPSADSEFATVGGAILLLILYRLLKRRRPV